MPRELRAKTAAQATGPARATPPISNPSTQGRLYGLLRNSDVFILVADLTLDAVAQIKEVMSELDQWGFRMLERGDETDRRSPSLTKQTILVGNKADVDGALDQFEELESAFRERYPVVMLSALEEVGLDELASEIFRALNVIRVYTKSPSEKLEDFERTDPFVLPAGSNVAEAADKVHKDLGRGLKFAVLWGQSGKCQGQRVGRNHELSDGDVVELHG